MAANRAVFPLQTMARALGVSRGGFHAWPSRPASARSRADAALADRIAQIHHASRETCGAPRIPAALADEGTRVGRKRVERLMRLTAVLGVRRREGPRTTLRDPRVRPACDPVSRNFTADAPNRPWVAAIACVPTWAGFLYLAVVPDAFSRRSVGWAMGHDLEAQRVSDAMTMAIGQRRPRDVIRHSDQGARSTSVAFGLRCKEAGGRPSMGSVGDACDNAMCESFLATLGCELLARRKVQTQAEARMALFQLVEGWCNPARRHSALGCKSPTALERSAGGRLTPTTP